MSVGLGCADDPHLSAAANSIHAIIVAFHVASAPANMTASASLFALLDVRQQHHLGGLLVPLCEDKLCHALHHLTNPDLGSRRASFVCVAVDGLSYTGESSHFADPD